MSPRTSQDSSNNQEKGSSEWINTYVNGGVMILNCVQDAAKITSVPHLAGAAGLTLTIVEAVRQVKNNKKDFRRLADDASLRIAAIYGAYQKSRNQVAWPPTELEQPIILLVSTLEEILKLIKQNIAKNKNVFRGFFDNKDDMGKVKELREKLQSASEQFQISSNLSSNDCLDLVLKQQEKIMARLEISPSPQEAIHILNSKLNANNEPARAAEEEQKQHITTQKRECEQLNEATSSRSEAVADAGASSSKLATEQGSGVFPQNQPLNVNVGEQSDEEENGQTVISASSSDASGSTDEEDRGRRRKAGEQEREKTTSKNKGKATKRPKSAPQTSSPSPEPQQKATPSMAQPSVEELLSAYLTGLGLNPGTGQPYPSPPPQSPYNTSYNTPPSQTPHSSQAHGNQSAPGSPSPAPQHTPYATAPPQHYVNPPNGSYFNQPYPNSPPAMPYYPSSSQSPPPWTTPHGGQTNSPFSPGIWAFPGSINNNVGNLIGNTISNVANDNRTIYHGPAPRRRQTRRDD